MGGGTSSTMDFNSQDWKIVSSTDKYKVVENEKLKLHGQQYVIAPPAENTLEEEKKTYEWRNAHLGPVVKVLGASLEKSGYGFCGSKTSVNVVTEEISSTLDQVGRLSERDEKVVLYNALKGFSETKKFGVPHVTQKMIAFNKESQVRVWINENFGKNCLEEGPQQEKSFRTSNELIKSVVEAVRPHAPIYPQRQDFYAKLCSFQDAEDALAAMRSYQLGLTPSQLEGNLTSIGIQPTNSAPQKLKSAPPPYLSETKVYQSSPNKPRISFTYLNSAQI